MRKFNFLTATVAVALIASSLYLANAVADDEEKKDKVDFSKVKCLINPKAKAKEANAAEYKGGKVYTCCGGCLAKFKKSPEKFATSANWQLVSTKQFVQTKCPISGGKINPSKTAEIGGVKVGFCCGNCLGKVTKADDKEKAEIAFSEKAFKKGFVKAEKK